MVAACRIAAIARALSRPARGFICSGLRLVSRVRVIVRHAEQATGEVYYCWRAGRSATVSAMSDDKDDDLKKRLGANAWMKTLDDHMRASKDAIEKPPFAPGSTPEERSAGFIDSMMPNKPRPFGEPENIRAVVRVIDDRLMAVKLVSPAGNISYAIYDRDTMRPVRDGADSLTELLHRYPTQN